MLAMAIQLSTVFSNDFVTAVPDYEHAWQDAFCLPTLLP